MYESFCVTTKDMSAQRQQRSHRCCSCSLALQVDEVFVLCTHCKRPQCADCVLRHVFISPDLADADNTEDTHVALVPLKRSENDWEVGSLQVGCPACLENGYGGFTSIASNGVVDIMEAEGVRAVAARLIETDDDDSRVAVYDPRGDTPYVLTRTGDTRDVVALEVPRSLRQVTDGSDDEGSDSD